MEILAVIWAPVRVLREAAAGRRVLAGFTVAAAFALLGLAGSVLAVLGGITSVPLRGSRSLVCHRGPSGPIDNLRIITMMGVIVSSTLTPIVVWIGVSLIMQLVTRFFNGSGPLPAVLALVDISGVPISRPPRRPGSSSPACRRLSGRRVPPRRRSDTWESCSGSPPSRGS